LDKLLVLTINLCNLLGGYPSSMKLQNGGGNLFLTVIR